MPSKRICVVCREKPATIPDRTRMGRPIPRLCADCHADRLRGDLRRVLTAQRPKLEGIDG